MTIDDIKKVLQAVHATGWMSLPDPEVATPDKVAEDVAALLFYYPEKF
jgi:hypothetical protein